MKQLNAAEKIREVLGCYNIQMHKVEAEPKRKKVRYGEIIRMAAAKARATPERLRTHKIYTEIAANRKAGLPF